MYPNFMCNFLQGEKLSHITNKHEIVIMKSLHSLEYKTWI